MPTGIVQFESAKLRTLVALAAGSCVLLIACTLRFVPRVNDALTGQPQYLHAIADQMARSLAERTNHEFPVLVEHQENYDCDRIGNLPSQDTDDLYYVFAFSEKAKSLCFITYQPAETRAASISTQRIGSKTDETFGQPLRNEILAEPIAHFSLRFPDSYLILLHWRTPIDHALLAHAGSAQIRRAIPKSMPLTDIDISVQLPELRESVARRHKAVNLVLSCLIAISSLSAAMFTFKGWRLYRAVVEECTRYGKQLRVSEFLTADLYFVAAAAERHYRDAQEAAAKALRHETVLKQSREQVAVRLVRLLEIIQDESARDNIVRAIERSDLAQMRQIVQEVEAQISQATPEERILSLVESVEQFCSPEELGTLRTQALTILREVGFRPSRSFVIDAHDKFRLRAKALAAGVTELGCDQANQTG